MEAKKEKNSEWLNEILAFVKYQRDEMKEGQSLMVFATDDKAEENKGCAYIGGKRESNILALFYGISNHEEVRKIITTALNVFFRKASMEESRKLLDEMLQGVAFTEVMSRAEFEKIKK